MTTERKGLHRNQVAEMVGIEPGFDNSGDSVELPFLRPVALDTTCGIEPIRRDRQSAVFISRTCDVMADRNPGETLSAEEIRRAESISHSGRKSGFIAGRRMLRRILSEVTDNAVRPSQWRFKIGPYGKPKVAKGFPPIFFNLSHSRGYVAIVVSRESAVGVDLDQVEYSKFEPVMDVLHPDERRILAELAPGQRNWAFSAIWTAKEACTKALGLGTNIEFGRLKVDLDRQAIRLPSKYGCQINSLELAIQSISMMDGSGFSLATVNCDSKFAIL